MFGQRQACVQVKPGFFPCWQPAFECGDIGISSIGDQTGRLFVQDSFRPLAIGDDQHVLILWKPRGSEDFFGRNIYGTGDVTFIELDFAERIQQKDRLPRVQQLFEFRSGVVLECFRSVRQGEKRQGHRADDDGDR